MVSWTSSRCQYKRYVAGRRIRRQVRRSLQILGLVCAAAAADTGAQANNWRQCLTDSRGAVEACTATIFLNPTSDGAFVNRGIAYRRRGDLDLAIRDYTEAIRLNPQAADAFNNRGNAYQNSGDFEHALADYDEAIRLNPAYAHAYNNRGVLFLECGNLDRATADFNQAIRHDPSYANAHRNKALALEQGGSS